MLFLFLVKLLESVVFMDIGDTVRWRVIASDHDCIREADFDVHTLLIEDAHAVAGQTLDSIKDSGTAYTLEVSMGAPALEIIKIAEKTKAGLIIMGSRGLGSLKGAVLGSVSQKVAQHAACPVMIVK